MEPVELALKDGTRVYVRPIRPDDADELRRGFARLSAESKRRRFFAGVSELTDAAVAYLTRVDGENHIAMIAYVTSLDMKRDVGVGVARCIRIAEEPDVAEVAVTVVDEFQNRGLGALLVRALADVARGKSIAKFRGETMEANTPVLHLLRDVGVELRPTGDGTVVFDLPIGGGGDGGGPGGGAGDAAGLLERFLGLAAAAKGLFVRSLRVPLS